MSTPSTVPAVESNAPFGAALNDLFITEGEGVYTCNVCVEHAARRQFAEGRGVRRSADLAEMRQHVGVEHEIRLRVEVINTHAPFGSVVADEFIELKENDATLPRRACTLCGFDGVSLLGELRRHVIKEHSNEYVERAEARGVALVQREGDFERYAAAVMRGEFDDDEPPFDDSAQENARHLIAR